VPSWRADSLAFVWLDPGITPCCKRRLKAFWVSDSVPSMRFAGMRTMMGRLDRDQGQLFYSFSLDDAVPDDHPVREIAAVLDLSWVHAELAPYYPQLGRPSIDPVTEC
jgi:hypothetical protein